MFCMMCILNSDAKIQFATKHNTPNLKLQADFNRLATWAKENSF